LRDSIAEGNGNGGFFGIRLFLNEKTRNEPMLDFQTLQDLSKGAAKADVACPLCASGCKTPSNRHRKVLRIWNHDDGFATFKCQRCAESGYAHDGNRSSKKTDPIDEIVAAFKPNVVVPFKQSEPDTSKTDMARVLWRRSMPARGTIVETYLRKRECYVDSQTVHFLPARGERPPGLIVPFGIPTEPEPGVLDISTANIFGVQITKLKPDGSGKAELEPNKITLGRCVGYPIVLVPPSDSMALTIAEGVEDALSIHLASGRGAWAAGGAGRMPDLADKVPDYVQSVTILVDDNDAGRRGSNGLARRLHARGIEVSLLNSGGIQ
jgi:Toprim domain